MSNNKFKEFEEMITRSHRNVTGIVVLKDGNTSYKQYFNDCNENSNLHIYSVSKSIISLLIGIAIEEGYIGSVEQSIFDFFPNYKIKNKQQAIQNTTIENLLTMTTAYKYKDSPLSYIKYFMSKDWVKYSLDLLVEEEPSSFRYTPIIGPDILSGILVNSTGMSVLDFANKYLFNYLEINVENNIILHSAKEQSRFNKSTTISGWIMDSKGTNSAGWGLTLSAVDMAKIGQLYLNNGVYNDHQIVSCDWINRSTEVNSNWNEMNLSYGYLWWIINPHEQSFAAMGDGGNTIYVNRDKNLVVAITGLYNKGVGDKISLITEAIEPLFE